MPEEKFTSIVRVLGKKYEDISEAERQKVLEIMEGRFINQKKFKEDLLRDFGSVENIPEAIRTIFLEREKTSEEVEIINIVNEKTNELRKKFGFSELNISPENIYVISQNAPWPKSLDPDYYYVPIGQFIVIREPKIKQLGSSKTIFTKNILHAIIHFKSYNALKKLENSSEFNVYKAGLENYKRGDDSKPYFGNLNEAIVEELTISLLKELESCLLLKDEFEQTEGIKKCLSEEKTKEGKPLLNGNEFYIAFDKETDTLHSAEFGRSQERRILNKLIDKIYRKNVGQFKNKEEVFDLFAKAVMTGRIMRMGKLIDKTFKEKPFRKIAEIYDINALEEYVDSLK